MNGRIGGLILAAMVSLLLGAGVASGSVYSELITGLTKTDNRLPGTTNFDQCLDAVKVELTRAGLEPHVQTFDTLVPKTEWCRLKVDGKEIGPVYPMNNGIAPLNTEGEIQGTLVWAGNGSLEAMTGKKVEGSIAMMDFDAPQLSVDNVFALGARAVIFISAGKATQWNIAQVSFEGPEMVPRLYIARDVAEKSGLLAAEGKPASIDARVVLTDAVARNLWVEIRGREGAQFRLNSEEAIVLSASLDTIGVAPDLCPQVRGAANAALLAQVACNLAGSKPERSVFVVFLGSHNWAQDGARWFYYAVDAAGRNSDDAFSLEFRKKTYADEKEWIERLLKTLGRPDVLEASDDDATVLRQKIKQKVVGWVNNVNADLRRMRIEKLSLDSRLRNPSAEDATPASKEQIKTKQVRLEAQITEFAARKSRWNDLRQQITNRRFNKEDMKGRETYREVAGAVGSDLTQRKQELDRLQAHFQTFDALSARMKNKSIVGHFDFDFANDRDPWLFSVIGAYKLFRVESLDTAGFLLHFSEIGKVYKDIQSSDWKATLFKEALNPTRNGQAVAGQTDAAPVAAEEGIAENPAPVPTNSPSAAVSRRASLFTEALSPYYKPFSLCVQTQRSVPATVATALGQVGFEMMTVGDPLDADELPYREPCDLSGLAPQMTALAGALATRKEVSLKAPFKRPTPDAVFFYYHKEGDDYNGVKCVNYAKTSSDVEGPALNGVILMRNSGDAVKQAGISRYSVARINGDGFVLAPLACMDVRNEHQLDLAAFGYDADGRLNRFSVKLPDASGNLTRLPLFYGYGGAPFSYGYAPDPVSQLYKPNTLDARTESPHKNSNSTQFSGLIGYYADRESRIKCIGGAGELILGSTAGNPNGIGVALNEKALMNLDGIRQCANDYWLLNESRLKVLRERNIVNDSLEILHAEAREHLDAAAKARDGLNHAEARAHEMFATCLGNRVYGPLRDVTDDLVKAVIVLLLLNIPFAFAMERLVFGFTSIYKQVVGFVGFFVATFLILYVTHPAFSLVSAPIVIFLAFTIIMLGGITVNIVMGKIRQEIKAIQGLASTVHGTGTDANTGLAAVLIGISGMRNRPMKTILTATTVILLTFTILVFASFTSKLGVVETYLGKGQDEDRIELHRFSYLDIQDDMLNAMEKLYSRDFKIFRRGGLLLNPTKPQDQGSTPASADRVVYNPANGKTAGFGAIFGLDPGEAQVNARIAAIVPGFGAESFPNPPIYLTASAVAKLGVKKGDELKLNGRSFTFAGEFSPVALQNTATIDDTKIVPPDFGGTLKNMGQTAGGGTDARFLEQTDVGNFAWFSPEQIAIAPIDALRRYYPVNTYVSFMTMYPKSGAVDIEKSGREIAPVFQGAVHVKSGDGKKRFFFTNVVAGSGFADVIVPLLLGGLIIFSSLMGSIVDREREIFTYSAMGLSPPDVGALFFAESAVYSVVGGMGGYLLSQLVAKLLAFLGSRGLFKPPEMNFSSLSSVLTILIVMAVVMLSTIYPAMKAGKSANPGVARKWRMPAPEGDELKFVFPFTVSKPDFAGILSFIKEHFENHGDATLGSFAAKDIRLFKQAGGTGEGASLGISANISLAPFDLGIFQTFRMYSKEFEIKGIEEVVVELKRVSGTPHSWIRSNRAFAAELRQQFLLWRSLPIEAVEHYRSNTAAVLKEWTKI